MKVAELIERLKNFNPDLDVVMFLEPQYRRSSPVDVATLLALDAKGDCFPCDEIQGRAVCGLLTPESRDEFNRLLAETPDEKMVSAARDLVRTYAMDGNDANGLMTAARILGAHFPLKELQQIMAKRNVRKYR